MNIVTNNDIESYINVYKSLHGFKPLNIPTKEDKFIEAIEDLQLEMELDFNQENDWEERYWTDIK